MNRTPWLLWDLPSGQPAEGASTLEAQAVLEHAFAAVPGAWDHPGLLHMYIHLMEMSPTPEAALKHGDRLTELVPDSGHLIHMATHIDVLCGDYQNVVARNRKGRPDRPEIRGAARRQRISTPSIASTTCISKPMARCSSASPRWRWRRPTG